MQFSDLNLKHREYFSDFFDLPDADVPVISIFIEEVLHMHELKARIILGIEALQRFNDFFSTVDQGATKLLDFVTRRSVWDLILLSKSIVLFNLLIAVKVHHCFSHFFEDLLSF